MRKTGLLKTIPLSFYSHQLYREVGKEWPGMGFVYLLLLVTLTTLAGFATPLAVAAMRLPPITATSPFDFEYLISQMPTLTFKDGELSVEGAEQHYYIRPKSSTAIGVIIDTTRAVSDWDTKDFNGVVLGKNQFLIRSNGQRRDEAKLYHYPPSLHRSFTREDLHGYLEKFLPWLWPLVILMFILALPMLIGIFFVYRILQMLLFGLFGMLISWLAKVPLEYPAIVRLASVSATPLLVIEALAMPLHMPIRWWVAFLIAMSYLFFAVKSNAEPT